MREHLHKFDTYFTKRIQAWPKALRRPMKLISMTGFPFATLGIGAGLIVAGSINSQIEYLLAGGTIFTTVALSSLLKIGLRRARPLTYIPKRWFVTTASFPSGHSTGAAAAYGTLAVLAIHFLPFQLGVWLAVLSGIWIVCVGLSRVYLGAHYPSDVIAGWLLGLAGTAVFAMGIA